MDSAGRKIAASGVAENRRLYPRRRLTFPATFTVDGETTSLPAFGLDLSGEGMRLFTRDPIPSGPRRALSLLAVVEGRKVEMRAHRRWSSAFQAPGGMRYRHGLELHGITDHDWEFLMNLTLEGGDGALRRAVLTALEVNRILGVAKQQKVVLALADAGRLAYDGGPRMPPLEYAFERYVMRQGTGCYKLAVRGAAPRHTGATKLAASVLVGIKTDLVKILD